MEQSREGFEKMVQHVENASHDDRAINADQKNQEISESTRGDLLNIVDIPLGKLLKKLRGAMGVDAAGAKQRLNKCVDEGRAEAIELNQEFDKLQLEVLLAKIDLINYANAHKDVVDENNSDFQQLKERVEDTVGAFKSFRVEKLDMSAEEEPAEVN